MLRRICSFVRWFSSVLDRYYFVSDFCAFVLTFILAFLFARLLPLVEPSFQSDVVEIVSVATSLDSSVLSYEGCWVCCSILFVAAFYFVEAVFFGFLTLFYVLRFLWRRFRG